MVQTAASVRSAPLYGIVIALTLSLSPVAFAVTDESVDFERQIRPLLIEHCGKCHGPAERKSSLRLDVRGPALRGGDGGPVIVPKKPDESELLHRITSKDNDLRMPPDGEPLTETAVTLIRNWIQSGAEWPETDFDRDAEYDPRTEHWAFQSLQPVTVPDVSDPQNAEATDIDRFLMRSLQNHGLSMNPPADRTTLVRRATLDLTGLPPTPDQIEEFVRDDRPDAWNRLIERLLSSPQYGERWAQHWLDVVRYADTHGFEVNTPREHAWPYRDYVIQSLNDDKPYDQFLRDQLTGDVHGADAATGFLVAAAALLPGQIGADDASKRLARQDALDEIITGTSSALLGLTLGCARCHDHKFDPLTQKDYYTFQAFFAGVEYGDRPVRDRESERRMLRLAELTEQERKLESQLRAVEPRACSVRTLILDEENSSRTTWLRKPNGPGSNPPGVQPGYRDDVGDHNRIANLSGGRYTWWDNQPGVDVMTWNPEVAGDFELWLSWGVHGSGVHTRDARYLLDDDGDLSTVHDQSELATVDQYYRSGITEGTTEMLPLWSGLRYIGRITLNSTSRIILRGGQTGTGITADVIVLQEYQESANSRITGTVETAAKTTESVTSVAGTPARFPLLRAPVSPAMNVERFTPTPVRLVRFSITETINGNQHEPCIDEMELFSPENPDVNVGLASAGVRVSSSGNYSETGIHQLRHINDGRYGNERSWISSERGGGWVQFELPDVTLLDRIVWSRDRNGRFQDRLPVSYRISVSVDGVSWQTVAGSDDRMPHGSPFEQTLPEQLTAVRAEKAELEKPRLVYAGTFREPDRTWLLRRGDPEQPVEMVEPLIPALFFRNDHNSGVADELPEITPEQRRRLVLADWISSPNNPLTARVMVNRIWLSHFGRGLVDTPSDFGLNGSRPSHPELLDWLALEFIRSGWSIKSMHRLMMRSRAYQQTATVSREKAGMDRDNTFLWRFESRRLEAEAIRDSMLAITGELNPKSGGPGFNFFKARGGLDGFPPVEDFGPEEMRRMIYSHKVRMEPVPDFGAFDCPDAGQSIPRRSRSTTAIQALNLMNSPFVAARSEKFAERLRDLTNGNPDHTSSSEGPSTGRQDESDVRNSGGQDALSLQVENAFRYAFGRSPLPEEHKAALQTAREHGLSTVCRVLFNSSEFLFLP